MATIAGHRCQAQVSLPYLPGGGQKLICPGRGTDVTLHDHPFWMFGEIFKLSTSIEGAIPKVVTVLPSPFSKANGVEQGASFESDRIWRSFLVRLDVLLEG